jgi:predicted transcriptional regulator/uncharacterized membrane protein
LTGSRWSGWLTFVVFILLVAAPLAGLSGGATHPPQGSPFTYTDEDGGIPTVFIGPDRVPVATWEDGQGRLRLSRLSLIDPSKVGLVLSNLPRATPAPIYGMVDVVAMDANGVLHVVWEDGEGGVWHKGYDSWGNVLIDNHRLSAVGAVTSAPAIAATLSREDAVAWVSFLETKDSTGTHVRIVSLDPKGAILTSALVDGWTANLGPRACDVAVDPSGDPHVTFLTATGAHWAVPDGEGGFDILAVHDAEDGSLPLNLFSKDGAAWVTWWDQSVLASMLVRSLEDGALGPAEAFFPFACDYMNKAIRASDAATVVAGGPIGTLAISHPTVYFIGVDQEGQLTMDDALLGSGFETWNKAEPSAATDDRGQTYLVWSIRSGDTASGSNFAVYDRAPDVTLDAPGLVHPDRASMVRPNGNVDVPVTIESQVGYAARLDLSVTHASGSTAFSADVDWDVIDLEPGTSSSVTVTFHATSEAVPGSVATYTVSAAPVGYPEAATTLDLHVEVPQYRPFIVRGPQGPIEAMPNSAVEAIIVLESWSSFDELITLDISAPKGWTFEAPDEVQLPTGTTLEVPITVTAPPATPAGSEVDIHIGGRTASGEEGSGTHVGAVVLPHSGVDVLVGTRGLTVRPGSNASREVQLVNTGNQALDIVLRAEPSCEGWTAEVLTPRLFLTPGSQTSVLVRVWAPADELYMSECSLRVVAAHEGGWTFGAASFLASVGKDVDYTMGIMPTSVPLQWGQAEVSILLVNRGNAPEELRVELSGLPEGWQLKAPGLLGPVVLEAGETRTVPVTITAPKDTGPGTVFIKATLWGALEPINQVIDVHVAQVFDADLVLEEATRTLTPPGTVVLPFSMVSTGNWDGVVVFSVEGVPFGWDYSFRTAEAMSTVSFPLARGEASEGQLALKVPADAMGETHSMDLVMRSADGDLLGRQTVYVRLRFPDLAVMDITISPLEPRAGSPLTVRARIANLGRSDAEDVTVVLMDGTTVIDRDQLSIVRGMGELTVVLYMVPSAGKRTLVIHVDPADEVRELTEVNNMVKRHITVSEAPKEPLVSPGLAQASLVAIVTLSVLGLLGGTEGGKYALFGLIIIPLYTKIKRDRVLDHYLRGKIHGYIIANPGEHYNAIKEQLEITNGALSYHLRVLEREGYVRSRMDGIYKRFYPSDMKLPTSQRNINSFQEVILTIVKNNQGLSQKDIAKRIGVSSQVINYHIKILEDGHLIKVDRTRRKSRVYATDAPTRVPAMD